MMEKELFELIHIGDRLTNKEVRRLLQSLYDRHNIRKRARATDITLFGIHTKRAIISIDGKRNEGIQIIR
jgi:hypothetical protein